MTAEAEQFRKVGILSYNRTAQIIYYCVIMGKISIPTSFNIDLEFEGAPFHLRMFAWIMDVFLQVCYLLVAFNVFAIARDNGGYNRYDLWSWQLLILLPVFCYHLILELFWNGQSVGKKILGLRVVNDNGGKPSPAQYMIRWLLRSSDLTVPIIIIAILTANFAYLQALWITSLMFLADLILIAVDKASKRLGDLAAGTLLIKVKSRGSLQDTIFMEVEDDYTPLFPQVMRLSDRDINTIKGILDAGRKSGNWQMVENAAERVKKVLMIEDTMPAYDFLDTLLKDYNYLSVR